MSLDTERRIVRDRPLSQLVERREQLAALVRRASLSPAVRQQLREEVTAVEEEIVRQGERLGPSEDGPAPDRGGNRG